MEIEIGEYIRTSTGKIGKLIRIEFDKVVESFKWYTFLGKDELGIEREICLYQPYIVSHSKNIIDLLEEGDYVNGQLVIVTKDIINDNGEKAILTENYDEWADNGVITNNDIKTILTKEQYEKNCYVVEG